MEKVEVVIPMDANNEVMMLLPPELLAYLELYKDTISKEILGVVYDIDMPKKAIGGVLHLQGQLKLVDELIEIHNRALRNEE